LTQQNLYLSRLVLEAIENPRKRNDFLAKFAEINNAKAAAIRVENLQLRSVSFHHTHGMDRSAIDSYEKHYGRLNPFSSCGVNAPGEVRTSDELLSEKELRRTEFYQDWMQPSGWMHTAAVALDKTETHRTILVAYRPPNHPFAESEIARFKDLAPHLALATQIAKTRVELESEINRLRNGAVQTETPTRLKLSVREHSVALALSRGLSAKDYAYKHGIAVSTVQSHVKNIHKKLGVHRRADLTRLLTEQ
jgi:DNA-binding CsgD family transcriptional regulator